MLQEICRRRPVGQVMCLLAVAFSVQQISNLPMPCSQSLMFVCCVPGAAHLGHVAQLPPQVQAAAVGAAAVAASIGQRRVYERIGAVGCACRYGTLVSREVVRSSNPPCMAGVSSHVQGAAVADHLPGAIMTANSWCCQSATAGTFLTPHKTVFV
jgi:hypothetical protein